MSALDVASPDEMQLSLTRLRGDQWNMVGVPVAAGRLGPQDNWPGFAQPIGRVPLYRPDIALVRDPLLVILGSDPTLPPWFAPGSFALLDQADAVRRAPAVNSWYAVRSHGNGFVRRIQRTGEVLMAGEIELPANRALLLGTVQGQVLWVGEDLRSAMRLAHRGRFLEGAWNPAASQ